MERFFAVGQLEKNLQSYLFDLSGGLHKYMNGINRTTGFR